MTEARTNPLEYGDGQLLSFAVHPLKSNKKPVGFAPWPKKEKKKRKRKRG